MQSGRRSQRDRGQGGTRRRRGRGHQDAQGETPSPPASCASVYTKDTPLYGDVPYLPGVQSRPGNGAILPSKRHLEAYPSHLRRTRAVAPPGSARQTGTQSRPSPCAARPPPAPSRACTRTGAHSPSRRPRRACPRRRRRRRRRPGAAPRPCVPCGIGKSCPAAGPWCRRWWAPRW